MAQLKGALARRVPRVQTQPVRAETLAVVGGGPSLACHLDKLAGLAKDGALILALNEAPHFLARHGIGAWAAVHLGPVEFTTQCIGEPLPGLRYFLASICPASSFDRLRDHDVAMWHAATDAPAADALMATDGAPVISGGQTVGLRALGLGWHLGFRRFVLFGFDSSSPLDRLHAYPSVSDHVDQANLRVHCNGSDFLTAPELAGQAQDLAAVWQWLRDRGAEISVVGEGLLPTIGSALARKHPPPPLMIESEAINGPVEVHALRF